MTIKLAEDIGPILTGRSTAADLRDKIESLLAGGEHVVVDLAGVSVVSPSFADELFAKVSRDALNSGRIEFVHLDEDTQHLMRFVLAGRPDDAA